jgi:hypothetical protein
MRHPGHEGLQSDLLAEPRSGDHFLRLYSEDAELVELLCPFVAHGVGRGEGVVLLIAREHRLQLERLVAQIDIPLAMLQSIGRVVVVDAGYLLQRLLRHGRPDRGLFRAALDGLLTQAEAGVSGRPVRIFGELVDLLWRVGDVAAATELERFWNEALTERRFALFCAYSLEGPAGARAFPPEICGAHSHVFDPEERRSGGLS